MVTWRAFIRACSQVTRALEAGLQADGGLSLAGYGLLSMLSEAPGRSLRMSVLADELGLTRSAITRLVDRLVAEGLVERAACPSDARGALAHLTDAGFACLESAYPAHLAQVRELFFDRLTPEQTRVLAAALGALTTCPPPGCGGA